MDARDKVHEHLASFTTGLSARNLAKRVGTSSKYMRYILASDSTLAAFSRTPYSKKKRNLWYLKENAPNIKHVHVYTGAQPQSPESEQDQVQE